MTPTLSRLDDLVADVAAEEMTTGEALAILRVWGMTPDRIALDDAVDCLRRRDGFLDHLGDPYALIGCDRPGGDAWEIAAQRCEQELEGALAVLAVRRMREAS